MKKFLLLFVLFSSFSVFAQKKVENLITDAGCGMCMFKKKNTEGCAMAVKIDNKIYTVEGIDKKHFGPMHSENGYCKALKKARITGEIRKEKFYATKFEYVNEKQQ